MTQHSDMGLNLTPYLSVLNSDTHLHARSSSLKKKEKKKKYEQEKKKKCSKEDRVSRGLINLPSYDASANR